MKDYTKAELIRQNTSLKRELNAIKASLSKKPISVRVRLKLACRAFIRELSR